MARAQTRQRASKIQQQECEKKRQSEAEYEGWHNSMSVQQLMN
jgi:hypothetical protein